MKKAVIMVCLLVSVITIFAFNSGNNQQQLPSQSSYIVIKSANLEIFQSSVETRLNQG